MKTKSSANKLFRTVVKITGEVNEKTVWLYWIIIFLKPL